MSTGVHDGAGLLTLPDHLLSPSLRGVNFTFLVFYSSSNDFEFHLWSIDLVRLFILNIFLYCQNSIILSRLPDFWWKLPSPYITSIHIWSILLCQKWSSCVSLYMRFVLQYQQLLTSYDACTNQLYIFYLCFGECVLDQFIPKYIRVLVQYMVKDMFNIYPEDFVERLHSLSAVNLVILKSYFNIHTKIGDLHLILIIAFWIAYWRLGLSEKNSCLCRIECHALFFRSCISIFLYIGSLSPGFLLYRYMWEECTGKRVRRYGYAINTQ